MELTKLKKQFNIARRGHKLLKDKRDELMKNFLQVVKDAKTLRQNLTQTWLDIQSAFNLANKAMHPFAVFEALMLPNTSATLDISYKNIMSVNVPRFSPTLNHNTDSKPYGDRGTTKELDEAVEKVVAAYPKMLKLAELEKSAQLMSDEIEKLRRRVNALEYIMIPQLEETIKYIVMKLDENERSNLTRLMKVKEMIYENK
jgi:V/A-type H+-transporting ATPase subunit D